MEIIKAIDLFQRVLECEVSEDTDNFYFKKDSGYSKLDEKLGKVVMLEELTKLERRQFDDGIFLRSDRYAEVLVRHKERVPVGRRSLDLEVTDTDNKLKYRLRPPSGAYLLSFFEVLDSRGLLERSFRRMSSDYYLQQIKKDNPDFNIFDYVGYALLRTLSLSVESEKALPTETQKSLMTAFVFNLGYNSNMTVLQVKSIEDFIGSDRTGRYQRCSPKDIDPPRRTYISDLVGHYQMATSAVSPYLEFLSYYHILEHFFENVYNESIIQQIRDRLTSPSFSYRRNKDIQELVSTIKKKLVIRSENASYSEPDALLATLQKFINIDDLRAEISNHNADLVEYYRTKTVPFSKADVFDLLSSDSDKVLRQISQRIYKTRNALVHSKDGDKERYTPFSDDKQLVPEIPLMRFLAESVILNSSRQIE